MPGRVTVGVFAGYVIGALAGFTLVPLVSSNTHDMSVEVAMTSTLIAGPIGTILGVVVGLFWKR